MDHSTSSQSMVTGSTVFDYNALPNCASSCKILLPMTTTSHLPPTTTMSTATLSTATLSTLTTSYTTLVAVQTPTTSAPLPTQTHVEVIKDQEPWLQQYGKHFAIIGAGLAILIALLMILIDFYKRHNCKSALENTGQHHPFIPLQDIHPLPSQPASPNTHHQSPLHPHSSSKSDLGYPVTPPGLTRPPPTLTFDATIRAYASDSQNNLREVQRTAGRCGTLCRSLSRTERLIMERIRMTGRPGIPISATPKVER